MHSPHLTQLHTDGYRALIDAIAAAFERALACGEAIAIADPRDAAIQAVALADGLAWHALAAPSALTPAAAAAALDAHLDRLLPARRGPS